MRIALSEDLIWDFALSRQGYVYRRIDGRNAVTAEPFSEQRAGPFYHFGVNRYSINGRYWWQEKCGYRRWVDMFKKPVLACWVKEETDLHSIIEWLQTTFTGSFDVAAVDTGRISNIIAGMPHVLDERYLYRIRFMQAKDAMRFKLAFDVLKVEEYNGRKQPRT